jgi:hypothetical protein
MLPSPSRSLIALLLAGCGVSLKEPLRTRHAAADFVEVPYPPPAALAETVPPSPKGDGLVWVDGEWVFRGRSYVWQRGGWVVPAPGVRFAPWRFVFTQDGRLLFAPGTWYDARGTRLERVEPAVDASTPPNEFTPERATAR